MFKKSMKTGYIYYKMLKKSLIIIFLTFYFAVATWKGPRKGHGRVMEKSLNFILGFLYEPWAA